MVKNRAKMLKYALLLIPLARAEEASVLTAASVIDLGGDIDSSYCPDPNELISGHFKTACSADNGSATNPIEFMIDLNKSMSLHTVFIFNYYPTVK